MNAQNKTSETYENKIVIENEASTLIDVKALAKAIWNKNSQPSLRTLRHWTRVGIIPCVQIGGRVYYVLEKVKAALGRREKYRKPPENPPPGIKRPVGRPRKSMSA